MTAPAPAAPETGATLTGSARSRWRLDALLLGLLALVIRLPALLASAHLTFDDGVYGSSVLAMRDGQAPFADVFSPQGPLHLPILYVFDLLGFRTLDAPRLATVTAGVVATVVTYGIGRRITSRYGAALAAALVATSGSLLYVTGPISGDGPALALATVAVLLALRYRDRPTAGRAVAVGLAIGAAMCVKLLVLPAAIVVGLLLLSHRRWRDFAVAVGTAVAVFVISSVPWGIDNVWEESVAYHQKSERIYGYGESFKRLVTTLIDRDPFLLAALGLSVITVAWVAWRRRGGTAAEVPATTSAEPNVPLRVATILLGIWAGAQVLMLVVEPVMWRPHVSQLIVPLALLAVLRPAPWAAMAIATLLLIPWYVHNVHPILWPDGYDRQEQAAVDRLDRLPDGALVLTDEPGLAWRAGHHPPGNFVDASIKRVQLKQITAAKLAHAARGEDVCAVLVWSDIRFGSLRGLAGRLEDAGYHVSERYGGPRVLYTRGRCG